MKTDEQINPVNSLERWDQSDRQKQTKVEDKIFWKVSFWAQSETVKKWWKVTAACSKLNRQSSSPLSLQGVISLGNAVPIVEKLPERMETAFPSLVFENALHGRRCKPFSGQNCTTLQYFAYAISIFLPVLRTSAAGAWTRTQIYTLAGRVPTVRVLQKNHWLFHTLRN